MEQPLITTTLGDIKVGRVNQSIDGYISVRCDRKTPLGNPYYMHTESERNLVCDNYTQWLGVAYANNYPITIKPAIDSITNRVLSGHNVLLQCWCAPKRCHCDSIKSFVLKLINDMPE